MMGKLYRSIWLRSIYRSFIHRYFMLMCYVTHHIAYEIRDLICNSSFRHGLINFFMNASAIFDDVACLSAIDLVSKFCIVSIYELSVVESRLTISIDTLSNARSGISVRTIDCRVFTRTSFFNWRHSCIYFCISNFISDKK